MDKPLRKRLSVGPLRSGDDVKAERKAMFEEWRREALEEG